MMYPRNEREEAWNKEEQVLKEALEHSPDVMDMFCPGLEKAVDVIQVDKDNVVEHVIHQNLKDGRGISEAKGHY